MAPKSLEAASRGKRKVSHGGKGHSDNRTKKAKIDAAPKGRSFEEDEAASDSSIDGPSDVEDGGANVMSDSTGVEKSQRAVGSSKAGGKTAGEGMFHGRVGTQCWRRC